tara:strand:- start:855 stop:1079 length:225 start_codon:yes stop_codon:yes gene_type:complete
MKCQIARGVRVHITKQEYDFILSIKDKMPFIISNLPIEQQPTAQRLADKSVFVRKKLATTTQCNLNKNIRFLYE